ncbi:unnamed protein product, partial [Laminaria digitata]
MQHPKPVRHAAAGTAATHAISGSGSGGGASSTSSGSDSDSDNDNGSDCDGEASDSEAASDSGASNSGDDDDDDEETTSGLCVSVIRLVLEDRDGGKWLESTRELQLATRETCKD